MCAEGIFKYFSVQEGRPTVDLKGLTMLSDSQLVLVCHDVMSRPKKFPRPGKGAPRCPGPRALLTPPSGGGGRAGTLVCPRVALGEPPRVPGRGP